MALNNERLELKPGKKSAKSSSFNNQSHLNCFSSSQCWAMWHFFRAKVPIDTEGLMGTSVHMPFASTRMPSPESTMKPMKSMNRCSFVGCWESHAAMYRSFSVDWRWWKSSTHIHSCQGTFTRPTCVEKKREKSWWVQKKSNNWSDYSRNNQKKQREKPSGKNPGSRSWPSSARRLTFENQILVG